MDNMDYDGMGNHGRFMSDDDIQYRQGKSKRQVEHSEKIISILFICMFIGVIGYTVVKFISNVI